MVLVVARLLETFLLLMHKFRWIRVLTLLPCWLLAWPTSTRSQTTVTNQRLFDTVGFVPNYYPQRIAIFQREPVLTGRVMFLGNSITEMGRWSKLLGDSTVVNRGISGDITFGVLKRLDDVVIRRPAKLFILIGINDIGKDIPDPVIANNLLKIITEVQLQSPNTIIFLESILPVNPDIPGFPQHYDKNPHVVSTNLLLKQVALETKVTFIDIYSLFNDGSGKLKKEYTIDGLHLNQQGYEYWVAFLKSKAYL
jgi:lysophospholipase L1-like esterase